MMKPRLSQLLRFLLSWQGLALIGALGLAGYFAWAEHRAHVIAIAPYLLLLACPLMHLFMHHGHGAGAKGAHHPASDDSGSAAVTPSPGTPGSRPRTIPVSGARIRAGRTARLATLGETRDNDRD
jgi:hypothetical protein